MSASSFKDLEARRQRALDEASAWLVRLQSNTLTTEDRGALTDWLRESPLHVSAILRVSHTDHMLSVFDGWDSLPVDPTALDDSVIEWPTSSPQAATPYRRRLSSWRLAAIAASVVLAAVMAGLPWWIGLIGSTTFRTATGERRDVALEDGSTVLLGPQTRLSVRLTAKERWVTLEKGEAVFRVSKDPTRPFYVDADWMRVRALGTQFGVERRAEGVLVTVAEGRVAVSHNEPSLLSTAPHSEGSAVVALGAGDQLSVTSQDIHSSSIRRVDTRSSLAWASGRLVFDNESLASVIERFNQYNSVQLHIADQELAQRRISGSFDATDLESLLGFLSTAVPATARREAGGHEIVLSLATPQSIR